MATPNDSKENAKGPIPDWLLDAGMKMLPWAIMSMIGANIGLYIDNINNKKDIARETWRNDQQDARADRSDIRDDRQDESVAELRDNQGEFQGETLHRLDILLEMREQQKRRNR